MKRREFFKASAAAAVAAVAAQGVTGCQTSPHPTGRAAGRREFYELRAYRLRDGSPRALLDSYLENAALPALNARGVKPVGVFNELEPKEGAKVWVLIPYPSAEAFAATAATMAGEMEEAKIGIDYLKSPKTAPAFERIDSWFLLAFAGLPKIEQPVYSREKKPRVFELRTYESHSEIKALKKISMFNNGEIDVMREVGLGPIFYGQALIGRDLPHLTYMLSAEDRDTHKKHWSAFGPHPTWKKMNADPQYADTVSKITSRFLAPTPYSQI
jgi:hypothetical protein